MKLDNAQASVYTEKSGVYYAKLSFDTGTHISGITVRQSPKYGGWWVQMPYFYNPKAGSTKRYIEFDQESPDKAIVERLCIDAVEASKDHQGTTNSYTDTQPSDEDIDKPIDFSEIPD